MLPKVLSLALFILGSGSNSFAETLVVPDEYANTPGGASQLPFAGQGIRWQNIYGSSHFIGAMPEGGIIHELAFRIDESDRRDISGAFSDFEVRMSTTPSLTPVLTFEYERHVGSDYTVVFPRGALSYSMQGAPNQPVNPFGLIIPLKELFHYDPRQGGLLVEFWVYQEPTGMGLRMDGVLASDTLGNGGNMASLFGEGTAALVLRTGFVIPEPSSVLLCFFGSLLLLDRSRIRSLTSSSQRRAKMLPEVFSFALFLLAPGSSSFAETLVVPNGYENTPGEGSQLPFAGNGIRYQNVFGASLFANAMPEGGFINEVSLRIDESNRRNYTGVIPDFELRMSTTPSLMPELTPEYARHVGNDYEVVYPRGSLSYSINNASAEEVNPFALRISLKEAFLYDPREGGLLVEYWVYGSASTALLVDSGRSQDAIGNSGNMSNLFGSDGAPLVTQLKYTAIPEPPSILLCFFGSLLFLDRRRIRNRRSRSEQRTKILPNLLAIALFHLTPGSNSFAETLVVPNGYENTSGEAAQGPFGGDGLRWQNVYGANLFVDSIPEGGIIHEVSLRIDESNRGSFSGSIPDFEMRMSTTPSLTPVLTLEYDRHIGSDYKTVFARGPLSFSIQGAPDDPVNPFQFRIPLDEPFYYDPRNGGLLIEFWTYRRSMPGLLIDGGRSLDALANGGNISNKSGGGGAPLITEVRFSAVPEPSQYFIFVLGTFLLFSRWRRLR